MSLNRIKCTRVLRDGKPPILGKSSICPWTKRRAQVCWNVGILAPRTCSGARDALACGGRSPGDGRCRWEDRRRRHEPLLRRWRSNRPRQFHPERRDGKRLPGTRLVKAFNTIWFKHLAGPTAPAAHAAPRHPACRRRPGSPMLPSGPRRKAAIGATLSWARGQPSTRTLSDVSARPTADTRLRDPRRISVTPDTPVRPTSRQAAHGEKRQLRCRLRARCPRAHPRAGYQGAGGTNAGRGARISRGAAAERAICSCSVRTESGDRRRRWAAAPSS
jgi:hypothetical protein